VTTVGLDDLARLRELLHDTAREPVAGIAELAAARTAAAGQLVLGRQVAEAEARWLLSQAQGDPQLAEPAAAVEAALQRLRDRCWACAAPSDLEVLFELAEARAEARVAGLDGAEVGLGQRIGRRVPEVVDLERLCQEADERWAAQTAGDDEQSLELQIEILRCTGEMLMSAAVAAGDRRLRRRLRRRGKRALRSADDRELARRTEAMLGRRGVAIMENTSFGLLALVLLLLIVEAVVELPAGQAHVLHWIDGLACLFFIGEFAFKLTQAPNRGSWFMRYAVTDLLPAIPAALFLLPGPNLTGHADDAVMVRMLRFFRVTWVARYVQALRPLLAPLRLLLLMVRGMDGLVRRFPALLDRNFVFFSNAADESDAGVDIDRRGLVFRVLGREKVLCASLPSDIRREVVRGRLQAVALRAAEMPGSWGEQRVERLGQRDVPVEHACQLLWSLHPDEIGQYLSRGDLVAIDRLVRVIRAPPVCWLPILRRFAVDPLPATAEERVVALGRLVARWLQGWQDRLEFFSDLHGIVTGPQILDRVASAMVRASQRPAVRLLLFGGLFLLVDLLIRSEGWNWLRNIVGLPLIVLGSVCLVFLVIGWWLKRVAGEASEAYRLTSEAHYLSLLELLKERTEGDDLAFLARRVFGDDVEPEAAVTRLRGRIGVAHGRPDNDDESERQLESLPPRRRREFDRVALLYLHFQDGAILHESDVKTTEQLLANLSMQNLRRFHLGFSKRDKKRLRALRLDDGSVFRGPFLWFRFITESVAVETAKRITEYNRRCPPKVQRALLDVAAEQELQQWLEKRSDPRVGRTLERLPPPDSSTRFGSTEFHALHFLTKRRDDEIRETFGEDVLAAMQSDRRNMIREIFGMRPVHRLPKTERSFNAWRFYWSRLSHGRVLILPVLSLWWFLRSVGWFIGRIRQIVREVLAPQLARQMQQRGEAPFAVAARKIHRMKAPGLIEAVRMRVLVDPSYCGAPAGWTEVPPAPRRSELERDLDFLALRERERAEFRDLAAENREAVAQLHAALSWLPEIAAEDGQCAPYDRKDGELAVTVAWLTDRDSIRALLGAEAWRLDELPDLIQGKRRVALTWRCWWWLRDRILGRHPTTRWLSRQGMKMDRLERRNLRASYSRDSRTRQVIDAWNSLSDEQEPTKAGVDKLREAWSDGASVRREVSALRSIQSLSVLDVRNYRDLVFRLGGYEDDGEDPSLARSLP